MISALDVHYDEDTLTGASARVLFERWEDEAAVAEYVTQELPRRRRDSV
jgi:hypothetical protein